MWPLGIKCRRRDRVLTSPRRRLANMADGTSGRRLSAQRLNPLSEGSILGLTSAGWLLDPKKGRYRCEGVISYATGISPLRNPQLPLSVVVWDRRFRAGGLER